MHAYETNKIQLIKPLSKGPLCVCGFTKHIRMQKDEYILRYKAFFFHETWSFHVAQFILTHDQDSSWVLGLQACDVTTFVEDVV